MRRERGGGGGGGGAGGGGVVEEEEEGEEEVKRQHKSKQMISPYFLLIRINNFNQAMRIKHRAEICQDGGLSHTLTHTHTHTLTHTQTHTLTPGTTRPYNSSRAKIQDANKGNGRICQFWCLLSLLKRY